VLVDDWYQGKGQVLLQGKAGRKAVFSDSGVMAGGIHQRFQFNADRPLFCVICDDDAGTWALSPIRSSRW